MPNRPNTIEDWHGSGNFHYPVLCNSFRCCPSSEHNRARSQSSAFFLFNFLCFFVQPARVLPGSSGLSRSPTFGYLLSETCRCVCDGTVLQRARGKRRTPQPSRLPKPRSPRSERRLGDRPGFNCGRRERCSEDARFRSETIGIRREKTSTNH